MNALIVDDVEQNREVLFKILSSLGRKVRLAESGEQALKLIRREIWLRSKPSARRAGAWRRLWKS